MSCPYSEQKSLDCRLILTLHQQSLAWGVSKKVHVVQRADNQILFYWFRKD